MNSLKDIKSFIEGRMKIVNKESKEWYAYRDVLYLVKQHLKSEGMHHLIIMEE